jgi:hypothetical protein
VLIGRRGDVPDMSETIVWCCGVVWCDVVCYGVLCWIGCLSLLISYRAWSCPVVFYGTVTLFVCMRRSVSLSAILRE